jgi:hypothetical protein
LHAIGVDIATSYVAEAQSRLRQDSESSCRAIRMSVDSEADEDPLPVDAVNTVKIDFALEAKCNAETNSVGVREVSRLISRLRHRNFDVFVTPAYFNSC